MSDPGLVIPDWLCPNSNLLPPIYKKVWESVRTQGNRPLVDTNKVFPLLLTSRLSTEVLGFIWTLANREYAGQLTEQELYLVLALIALAQSSLSFGSLAVLSSVYDPLCPTLSLETTDDEFTEFQSAPSVVSNSFDPKVGSRLANHNLGSSKKKVTSNTTCEESLNKIIDLFPKCNLKTQTNIVVLKDTAIRNGTNVGSQDLMNLQTSEDKYSALRELIDTSNAVENSNSTENSVAADDFGDFVSADFNSFPNDIKSEEKVTVAPLASVPDTNLKGLPRNSSEQSLDLNSFLSYPQEDEQDSDSMQQVIYWEWKQYMESCVFLLQVASNVFNSISSENVLREVLSSAKGFNFLCNLSEIAAVCRRVNFSHKEMDISIMGFDDLLMDIDRIWGEMEPFYANVPIVTEIPAWPVHPGYDVACALCLTVINGDRIVFNDYNYHATCANLWLFTVSNNLPALQYPIATYNVCTQSTSVPHLDRHHR